MCVQTGVSCCTSQFLAVFVAYVFATTRIFVSFRQTEIDYVDHLLVLASADKKVIRFNIAMDEPTGMNVLDSLEHLYADH
jgi:hypothetical protein